MKVCIKCKKTKDVSEFYKVRKGSTELQGYCKECSNLHHKIYHKANQQKLAKRTADWINTNIKGHSVSTSAKRIEPEKVKRDNSDVWRYSPEIFSALRKEKFSKADPEAYLAYKEALGEIALVSPYDDLDLQMDLRKFRNSLTEADAELFGLMLLGMKQEEIADVVGLSQTSISFKLKRLRELFKEFYYDED